MHEHVTDAALDRYLSGVADGTELARVRASIAECAQCAEACGAILRVDAALRARHIDVPDGLVERQLARLDYATLEPNRGLRPTVVRAAALFLAVAVGALAATIGPRLLGSRNRAAQPAEYLLLLSGSQASELSAVRRRSIGQAFARWTDSLARAGVLDQQAQLDRVALDPVRGDPAGVDSTTVAALARVEGFFLVRAGSDDDAIALARSSPYLDFGGTIVVRRRRLPVARALASVRPYYATQNTPNTPNAQKTAARDGRSRWRF